MQTQAKYEKLLTEIEEARFKRANYQYQFAMMMAQQEQTEKEESKKNKK